MQGEVPQNKGVLGHYFPFIVNFTHEITNFPVKRAYQPLQPPLDPPLRFFYNLPSVIELSKCVIKYHTSVHLHDQKNTSHDQHDVLFISW